MRTLFGVVLGVALTIGAAFFHDNNVPQNPPGQSLSDKQIVNWDVLGAVSHDITDYFAELWGRVVNRRG
jgi:hypothetical protein